jgi:diguanylate cyclase (GGDEF)-like protein
MCQSMQRVRFRSLIAAAKGEPIGQVLEHLLHSFSGGGGAEQRCVITDADGVILASVVTELPVGSMLPAAGHEPTVFGQFTRWSEDFRNPKSGDLIGGLFVFDYRERTHPFSRRNAVDVAEVAGIILDRYQWDQQLQVMAWTDGLTGLANRGKFRYEMKRIEERCGDDGDRGCGGYGLSPSLLFVDLDRFKAINDTFGHAAGDAVLREVGQRLLAVSSSDDVVARIGGDEFAILCVRTESETLDLLQRVRAVFDTTVVVDGLEHVVGGSVGYARATDRDLRTANRIEINELLSAADTAMFAEKLRRRSTDTGVRRSTDTGVRRSTDTGVRRSTDTGVSALSSSRSLTSH